MRGRGWHADAQLELVRILRQHLQLVAQILHLPLEPGRRAARLGELRVERGDALGSPLGGPSPVRHKLLYVALHAADLVEVALPREQWVVPHGPLPVQTLALRQVGRHAGPERQRRLHSDTFVFARESSKQLLF